MNRFILIATFLSLAFMSCSKDNGVITPDTPQEATHVRPINVDEKGFELLEKMQGHWVGSNQVVGTDYEWFAFDYRAISPSQVQGIFEGGSQGNLLTSFFITDYKGVRTIMARNGGLLNGIYRMSYFVLDRVEHSAEQSYYRLVDALGGEDIMYMELWFEGDQLKWEAYTSRLGQKPEPTKHMAFEGKRHDMTLANTAAESVGFPQNIVQHSFAQGFNEECTQASEGAKSATFLAQSDIKNVYELAIEAGDPYPLQDHPYLSSLQVSIDIDTTHKEGILLYLSKETILTANGNLTADLEAYNSILVFPYLVQGHTDFLVTYLHPGNYHVTAIIDKNEDGIPSEGDITHLPVAVEVLPETNANISIRDINIQN